MTITRRTFRPFILALAVALCFFQLSTSLGVLLLDPMMVRAGHVGIIFVILFLWRSPVGKYRRNPEEEPKLFLLLDAALAVASFLSALYIIRDLADIQNMMPGIDELTLEEPEIVHQGGRYGVRLRASAPSEMKHS